MNMLFNDKYIMLCINDNVHGKVIVKKRKYISNSVFLLKYYANNRSYKDYHIFDDYNRCELNNQYYKFIKDKLVIFMNQDRIRFITQTGIVIEYPMPMYVPIYLHILKDILFDPLHSFIKNYLMVIIMVNILYSMSIVQNQQCFIEKICLSHINYHILKKLNLIINNRMYDLRSFIAHVDTITFYNSMQINGYRYGNVFNNKSDVLFSNIKQRYAFANNMLYNSYIIRSTENFSLGRQYHKFIKGKCSIIRNDDVLIFTTKTTLSNYSVCHQKCRITFASKNPIYLLTDRLSGFSDYMTRMLSR